VLAHARHYFGLEPQRYQGHDPGTPTPQKPTLPHPDGFGPTD
jgi:hypothetical protein